MKIHNSLSVFTERIHWQLPKVTVCSDKIIVGLELHYVCLERTVQLPFARIGKF